MHYRLSEAIAGLLSVRSVAVQTNNDDCVRLPCASLHACADCGVK